MSRPAARISDMHTCPMVNPGPVPHVGGPISVGAPTVITMGMPQARVGDMAICTGPPDTIAVGSATVIVSGMPAARMGDATIHGGVIVSGAMTVLIGDGVGGGGGGGAFSSVVAGGAAGFPNPSAQAQAAIAAARDGLPFCEVCQQ